jgi:hypothetical protein
MKYEMSVIERILLLNCLPQEEDILTIRIIRELKADLSFSEEEHAQLGIEVVPNGLKWKQEIRKEIEIGEKAKTVIASGLQKLDREKKLTENHIPLWEKFVEAGEKGPVN